MIKPYRIVAKIKNNRLWHAVTTRFPDVTNQHEAAQRLGLKDTEFGRYVNMCVFPARIVDGQYVYRPTAHRIADLLGQDVEWLFDPQLYEGKVPSRLTVEVGLQALTASHTRELPPGPGELAETSERDQLLRDAIAQLNPREALVLSKRFGLDGGEEYTLREIAQEIGLSGNRVNQIEARALEKLRHPHFTKRLRLA